MPKWKRWLLRHNGHIVAAIWVVWAVCGLLVFAGRWKAPGQWVVLLMASGIATGAIRTWARAQREKLVREAPMPQYLKRKLRETYPGLRAKDCDLVERGLRQFFWASLRSRNQFVAMPSQAVDAMWHEFILNTKAYRDWCELALGRFMHHTPAEALGAQSTNNDGLRRTWYWACRDEAIKPRSPSRLPLLFALDAKLAIPGGFHYEADCHDIVKKSHAGAAATSAGFVTFCGTDFSSDSFSGSSNDFGGSDSSASSSSGDSSSSDSSSSDGGSSCGSGCGGGGCGGGGD